jgi:tetratricopeptide (TPR) repeat protein
VRSWIAGKDYIYMADSAVNKISLRRFCLYKKQALTNLRSTHRNLFFSLLFACVTCLGIAACDSQKQTVASRGMQNLTAHYNILYNARELVSASERNIQLAGSDDYERLIPVYKEPTEDLSLPEIKNLDEAILKANVIVNEKSGSNYVDDAYFLIAKANHLKANFYNASEFFTYVYKSYPEEKELRQAALAWMARSYIQSERFEEAEATLDTALKYISIEKESVGDIYATRAQLHLYAQQDEEAITLLEQAIKHAPNHQYKIRWTYLLAQLQQLKGDTEAAYTNYTAVVKSNAPFDMAFNANLSRISIRDEQSGNKSDRSQQLRTLLRDDKNRDFIDQIYFQMGNSYADEKDVEKAIENYNAAIKSSTKNVTQKGLAYLKLAEIYFNQSDFIRSKNYYDSTLAALPKTYPDYELISKKAANLETLADRLTIISREDTLQMLAGLPDAERELRIGALVREQALKALDNAVAGGAVPGSSGTAQGTGNRGGDGRFYFNNAAALNQGLIDFKKQWGNRKLEDNWRRSQKSPGDMSTSLSPDQAIANQPFQQVIPDPVASNIETIRRTFIEDMPLTAEQRAASDQKIAAAYYDVGNYYRDVSLDTLAALNTYEKLLSRFPENPNKLAVYYNLYRLYRNSQPERSEQFKNILLSDFPDSPFARIILDPQYDQKADEQDLAFNRFYNEAYDLYSKRQYSGVLAHIDTYGKEFTGRPMPAQLDYLRALAVGRTQQLPQLETAFRELVSAYPDEQLVVPLVKEHLAFIDSNRMMIASRPVALIDNDPDRDRFVQEPVEQPAIAQRPVADSPPPAESSPAPAALPVEANIPATENAFFVKEEAALFYFVVNISDPRVNLSSSRFGIGQFNRINLPGSGIKHQLKSVGDQNQLIFVGPFEGREAAQNYFNNISPMMKEIMKIPAAKYSTFFINQQNLDKITDSQSLDRYVEFYKSTY